VIFIFKERPKYKIKPMTSIQMEKHS